METLMDVDSVLRELETLDNQEAQLNSEIDEILFRRALPEALSQQIESARQCSEAIADDISHLCQRLSFSAQLAESVSGKIRHLDNAKQRVEETLQRIEDILDLRFCTEGVRNAMQNEDYEIAAGHIHRFLKMDESLLLKSAEDMQQQGSLNESLTLLHQAQQKLKSIINDKFDEALNSKDSANVERLFKIFPLLNLHEHGLKRFCGSLCLQIVDQAEKNFSSASLVSNDNSKKTNTVFVDLITKLVENVAKTVETYQPLVETYYGSAYLLSFIKHLQAECDAQGARVMKEFMTQRRFREKSKQIQLLMRKANKNSQSSLRTVIDPLELDSLLIEVTVMNTRVDLYFRFLQRKLLSDFADVDSNEEQKSKKLKEVKLLINNCELSRTMQEIIGHYIAIEEYFMRQSVSKAVTMEQIDDNSLTSSMVDDVFFVVRKSVRRALSSNSVDGICAILNHAVTLLQEDFADLLHSKLKNNTYVMYTIDLSQAYYSMMGSNTQYDMNAYDKNRKTYLSHLNDADVSMDYIKTLAGTLRNEIDTLLTDVSDRDREKIQSTLNDLSRASDAFQVVVDFAISQLHTAILKPRLKPLVDAFAQVNHNLTEEEFSLYETTDPFVENFVFNVRTLLGFFESALTKNNYVLLVKYVGVEIADLMEKVVLKQKYNRLGGLQLDKEMRALLHYITATADWSIRDKFTRLTQVVAILNVDSLSEFSDMWNPSSGLGLSWRLAPSEVRQVLQLRLDFRSDELKRLKL